MSVVSGIEHRSAEQLPVATLTVLRLDAPPTLARTLRSTNAIESMIGICREHAKNVKLWRDGQMVLRWCAAGMVQASKQFRRVNGHCTCPPCGQRWNGMSLPKPSEPTATLKT